MTASVGPVQRNVPLPSTRGALRQAIAEMQVGESRLMTGYTDSYIRTAARRNGMFVRVRPEGDGLRVWRIA